MSGDDDGQRPDEQIYVIQAECHSTAARQLIEKAPEIDRFLKQKLDEVILSFAANSADELSQGLAPASYHALAKAMWAKVRHESEAQTGMLRTLSDWFKGCVVGRMGYVGVAQCFCFEVRIGATCETFWLQLLFEESSPVRPAPANTSRSIQRKSKFSILSRMFRPARTTWLEHLVTSPPLPSLLAHGTERSSRGPLGKPEIRQAADHAGCLRASSR
eukprot:gnl/TRDRNA2_/TRDRNA2_129638_c0_seq4.p1 gnl/TRDRNA2_/TRDRNA2_129638_c0~~gnl/TRDRNA2_/TRDRNA2_129638_c0_seq4.p1  ORF type:complete len:224 (+),score=33.89 gnl/TRDRNA2_/TRDRNA2_129638_c0_seq4:23-673(+)